MCILLDNKNLPFLFIHVLDLISTTIRQNSEIIVSCLYAIGIDIEIITTVCFLNFEKDQIWMFTKLIHLNNNKLLFGGDL